jgi:hypothetical protein
MKGLYVYGAMTMALSFYAGVLAGNTYIMLAALLAAALSALGEALIEVAENAGQRTRRMVGRTANIVAVMSWATTAAAALFAAATLL